MKQTINHLINQLINHHHVVMFLSRVALKPLAEIILTNREKER
jgi:hypothetical protein